MDHFQAVPLVQRRLGPSLSGNDVAVQLHRDTVRLHAELFNQGEKGERGRNVHEITLFSINMQFHREVGGVLAPQAELYRVLLLVGFAQDKLAGGRAPFEVRLHQ